MPQTLKTASDVLDALGRRKDAALLLGISIEGVCNMAARGRIHPRHYFAIRDALAHKGLAPDEAVFRESKGGRA